MARSSISVSSPPQGLPVHSSPWRCGSGTVLTVAGVSVALLQWRDALGSYAALQAYLAAIVVVLLVVGGACMRAPVAAPANPQGSQSTPNWPGLLVVVVVFVGQVGFLSYVVQEARTGVEFAAWVLGGVKAVAGVVLLVWALRQAEEAHGLLGLGVMLGACVVLASVVQSVMLLVVALLAFEISFNILSARLQARVVTTPHSATLAHRGDLSGCGGRTAAPRCVHRRRAGRLVRGAGRRDGAGAGSLEPPAPVRLTALPRLQRLARLGGDRVGAQLGGVVVDLRGDDQLVGLGALDERCELAPHGRGRADRRARQGLGDHGLLLP